MTMQIICQQENPYGQLILEHFQEQFPKVTEQTKESLLEIISKLLIGTKELRYGSLPTIESQYTIRQVIAEAINRNEPIPILIPWGGIKQGSDALVDVAEISAIKQIIAVDNLIKQYYEPGIYANIRIEDTGAMWLYRKDKTAMDSIEKYSKDFTILTDMLCDIDNIIIPVKESDKMDQTEYFHLSEMYSIAILNYLSETEDNSSPLGVGTSYSILKSMGWSGEIPHTQRDYYYRRYAALDPGKPLLLYRKMLADYLGGAMARYKLNGRCAPNSDYGHIQISFVAPVPGAPVAMFNNNVYWRTIPLSQGRTHIPAWRAKGYLSITDNCIKTKITNWGNELTQNLIKDTITLKEGHIELTVQADYLLTD